MKPTRTTALALAAATLALTAAGCGGSSTKPGAADQAISAAPADTATDTTTASTASTPTATVDTSGKGAVLPISTDLKKKPAIPKPKGAPPKDLVVKDIVVGKGATAKAGSAITVKYVGVSFSTGKQFDASWDRGDDFPFTLGQGAVIPGWDEGVEGMKVGGRRELVIPADKAYGAQGSPPAIGPNETLVFVIDLVKA
ncbi:MAG: fkbP 2 [Solirubrobacterales bacterium]|nr:fkbP 2 [Solirubrobacterales bacterium]